MRNCKIFSCLIFAVVANIAVYAQAIEGVSVLDVPLPGNYTLLHESSEPNFGVIYHKVIAPERQIYARIFIAKLDDLKAQASSIPNGKCALYRFFWRKPVTRRGDLLLLDELIDIYEHSSNNDQDYVVVFEDGAGRPVDNKALKLKSADAKAYFSHGIPFHIYASPADQQRRFAEAERFRSFVPPVIAAVAPTVVPVVFEIVECTQVAKATVSLLPVQTQIASDSEDISGIQPTTLARVFPLESRSCGG
jgi:hypothetical protein